ncbi:MAG: DNA primase [Candidatus Babeliaceae bacterium]|jgi:DNA primase
MNVFTLIKSRISILDIVSEYATLTRAGFYWKGRCPLHHEKTASFTVSPHKGIYYCFGCQSGGDVIAFIAAIENYTPLEAAHYLIDRYAIEIPAEILTEKSFGNPSKKKYFEAYLHTAQWCNQQLVAHQEAANYLNARNISQESIKYFTLGYFPSQQSLKGLLAYCLEHNILAQDLIQAGIITEHKNSLYSPFEERIIFPIKDSNGRFCGFGGRTFKAHDDRAKYYNSPDHEYFVKGSLLFGLEAAKKEIQKTGTAFVVEGYTDCIAMVQAGFKQTVATLGTACTQEHLKILSRHALHVTFIYDGDTAGQNAMLRLTHLCWSFNIEISVIVLPPEDDPASFLGKQGDFNNLINLKQDIFHFFIDKEGSSFPTQPLQKQMGIVRQIISLIVELDDPLRQTLLFQRASTALGIPIDTLYKQANGIKKNTLEHNKDKNNDKKVLSEITKLEKKIFSAILNPLTIVPQEDEEFIIKRLSQPLGDLLQKAKGFGINDKQDMFDQFFDTLTTDEKNIVSCVLIESGYHAQNDNLEDLIHQFYKKQWKMIVNNVKLKLSEAHTIHHAELNNTVLEEFLMLKQKMLQKGLI